MHHRGEGIIQIGLRGQGFPVLTAELLRTVWCCSSWVDKVLSNLFQSLGWGLDDDTLRSLPNCIIWWLCSLQAHTLCSQSFLCLFTDAKKVEDCYQVLYQICFAINQLSQASTSFPGGSLCSMDDRVVKHPDPWTQRIRRTLKSPHPLHTPWWHRLLWCLITPALSTCPRASCWHQAWKALLPASGSCGSELRS